MAVTYLTKEGFQKLQDELDYLRTAKRQEVAERLHEAMEGGELIENAEYEAAKNEQAFVEGRIQELDILLATAHLIEGQHDPSSVDVGDTVLVQIDEDEPEEYVIVGAAEADPRAGKISNESPLGKALLHRRPNDVVVVEAPGGSFKVKLLKTT
ncbi:MAG TPA: transcription elongation factor GreA [Anaerolineae bacterium]|jgi:transcription elongation factor GreA|nr:transcription elongation factor GreA [Anaerolineae bacterium]HAE60435.1 transcription elongation factor GreA [Anaerolineae bacterium]